MPIAGLGTPDSVKEANLPDGSSPNSHNLSVTDGLNIAWGADNNNSGNTDNRSVSFQHATASADVQITDVDGNTINGLTSNGALVHYTIFNNELIAYTGNDARFNQVFTVSLNDDGTGSYTFTLLSNLDHPNANGNNTLNLTFDYTATDADGDPSSNTFTVTVVDDVPTAHVGDTTLINEANLPDGNFRYSSAWSIRRSRAISHHLGRRQQHQPVRFEQQPLGLLHQFFHCFARRRGELYRFERPLCDP